MQACRVDYKRAFLTRCRFLLRILIFSADTSAKLGTGLGYVELGMGHHAFHATIARNGVTTPFMPPLLGTGHHAFHATIARNGVTTPFMPPLLPMAHAPSKRRRASSATGSRRRRAFACIPLFVLCLFFMFCAKCPPSVATTPAMVYAMCTGAHTLKSETTP